MQILVHTIFLKPHRLLRLSRYFMTGKNRKKNNKRQPFDCRLVTPTGFKPVTA